MHRKTFRKSSASSLGLLFLFWLLALTALPAISQAQELSDGELLPRKATSPEAISPEMPLIPPASGTASPEEDLPYGLISLALLLAGLILLFIEVALIPGFGVTGVTGIILILAGLALSFWKLDLKLAILFSLASMIGLIAIVVWAVYVFPHTRMGKRFVLQTTISAEDGFTATRDLGKYIGMEGTTTSDLRPSGIVRLGDERLDVMSDGEYIPRGTKIKVVKVKNGNLLVVPVPPVP